MKRALQFTGIMCLFAFLLAGQFVAPQPVSATEGGSLLKALDNEVATIVDKARPAVVRVNITKMVKQNVFDPFEGFEDFFGPRFRNQMGPRLREREFPIRGLGSGFIIDPDGTILTNSHVVSDSDELTVVMDDGKEYKATVVGTDPETEVAVIKIDAKNLPTLELGDSDGVKPGHVVIAIGSPQGLSQSVSLGIVSAISRSELGITTFDNFIQTDAAINRGNSGGPLLDSSGRVIGINTAIVSTTGGSEGLGLAVPINQVKQIAAKLRQNGKVTRGYMGIKMQQMLPEMAEYLGAKDKAGAIVSEVMPNSPAEGKLRKDDAIIGVNGKEVKNSAEIVNRVAAMSPGETVNLTVVRGGEQMEVKIKLTTRPDKDKLESGEIESGDSSDKDKGEAKEVEGFKVEMLTPDKAQALGLEPSTKGLVVTEVEPKSEAYRRGLRPDMVIEQVNQRPMNNLNDLKIALKAGQDKPGVLLRVRTAEGTALLLIPKKAK
jgi:serine protease Do